VGGQSSLSTRGHAQVGIGAQCETPQLRLGSPYATRLDKTRPAGSDGEGEPGGGHEHGCVRGQGRTSGRV
jgi:hypothetical protein